jgi:hypothetical protein
MLFSDNINSGNLKSKFFFFQNVHSTLFIKKRRITTKHVQRTPVCRITGDTTTHKQHNTITKRDQLTTTTPTHKARPKITETCKKKKLGCDILAQGLIGLIKITHTNKLQLLFWKPIKKTPKLSVLGLE